MGDTILIDLHSFDEKSNESLVFIRSTVVIFVSKIMYVFPLALHKENARLDHGLFNRIIVFTPTLGNSKFKKGTILSNQKMSNKNDLLKAV